MGIWAEVFGVPHGIDLRHKWWHQAAIAVATLSAVIVFLGVSTAVSRANIVLTTANTHSLTLLHYALGRAGTTTLDDLDDLAGLKARIMSDHRLIAVRRAAPPETIRCGNPAPYESEASFVDHGITYRAIPDRIGQSPTERRHCAATSAYAMTAADTIAVAVPDSSLVVVQSNKGFFAAMAATSGWLLVYWLVYYRVGIATYMRHRLARRRRRAQLVPR